jgi:hypothetical protein
MDAGRLWEHSLTGGDAVIESGLTLFRVAVRLQDSKCLDSAKEVLLSEQLSDEEALEAMGDLTKLLQFIRTRAAGIQAKCCEGYKLATHVSCSGRKLAR